MTTPTAEPAGVHRNVLTARDTPRALVKLERYRRGEWLPEGVSISDMDAAVAAEVVTVLRLLSGTEPELAAADDGTLAIELRLSPTEELFIEIEDGLIYALTLDEDGIPKNPSYGEEMTPLGWLSRHARLADGRQAHSEPTPTVGGATDGPP